MSTVHDDCVLLGLDLAWVESNPSGAVRLEPSSSGGYEATDATCLGDDREVLRWIEEYAPRGGPAIVAIDAPLIAPNPPGTGREADRRVSSRFGRHHAGVYPANRGNCARPIRLARALVDRGWSLDPADACRGRRCAIEVYPHAASIALLGLERIVKYKKGKVAARRQGLQRLQDLLHLRLPRLDPPIRPFAREDPHALRGKALKHLEDRLDALICAAMALRARTAPAACEVVGDVATGYILVPRLSA